MHFRRIPVFYKLVNKSLSTTTMRKAPGSGGAKGDKTLNQDFVDFLFELSTYEKNINRNTFKSNAYKKAAGVLAKLDYRITSGDEARKLDGIGDKISKKIDEFIHTGKLDKLEKIRSDDSNTAINLLTRVAGIGPAKARSLVDSGISTIEQLRDPSNKNLLTHGQQIGLCHFEDFEKRIPREEVEKIERVIQKQLVGLKDSYEKCNHRSFVATICGSYRRGLISSGDIDVLLTHPEHTTENLKHNPGNGSELLKRVVSSLQDDANLITDTLSLGGTKFMGVCKLPSNKGRQPQEELPVICEEDIFDYISFEWKEPEDRSL